LTTVDADHPLGDLRVVVVEDVVEQQHGALLRGQGLEQDEEGEGERVGHLDLAGRVLAGWGAEQRLWQPIADIGLASNPGRAQLIAGRPVTSRRESGLIGIDSPR
jgi:hypothetical protein